MTIIDNLNQAKMAQLKRSIRRLFKRAGFVLQRYPIKVRNPYIEKTVLMMDRFGIDTLFSVGANRGQYALELRKTGYGRRIISFEPLKSAFSVLAQNAANDPKWTVNNYALGNEDSTGVINVAGNSYSSSLLEMLPAHYESAPHSKYVGQEDIVVRKLDSIFDEFASDKDKIMLKIDTQGYEKHVLEGAMNSLDKIKVIQLEISVVPLYKDEILFVDMLHYMEEKGFKLYLMTEEFSDEHTGQLLQVNATFVKKELLSNLS